MNSSVFSIEIFIDRIRLLEGEKCYFPSTVLKFLNYEPAVISKIENDLQLQFREYLNLIDNSSKHQKIFQINELKDVDGNFIVRRGKSILFEANTISLISEFNTLPLYILVCDDYFQPNHLVGVIAIRLSQTILNLVRKISNNNHTVSEDVVGKFPIVNLIGDAIGMMTLKLRLIFVGASLAPHLPRDQEIEIRVKNNLVNPVDKSLQYGSMARQDEGKRIDPTNVLTRTMGCQTSVKKNIDIQVAPKEFSDVLKGNCLNFAKVGLTIDPNDPLLEDAPPIIYNSNYGNWSSSESDSEQKSIPKIEKERPQSLKFGKPTSDGVPAVNGHLDELKYWKSQESVRDDPKNNSRSLGKSVTNGAKKGRVKFVSRSKSEDNQRSFRPTFSAKSKEETREDFIKRLSMPKHRAQLPSGIVPSGKGWIRKEPEYCGPSRSTLNYKMTKTLVRRIELHNPDSSRLKMTASKQSRDVSIKIPSSDLSSVPKPSQSSDFTSPTHTPVPRLKRNPLVPPLFGTETSMSAPSFTVSGESSNTTEYLNRNSRAIKKGQQKSNKRSSVPENNIDDVNDNRNRQWNNNNQSQSYDTNETVNEADQYLNLNPVQSTRSPHMSVRSQTVPQVDSDVDESERSVIENDEENDLRLRRSHSRIHEEQSEYRSENMNLRSSRTGDEYSNDFNQFYSSDNFTGKSASKRLSIGSQISQTSEWRTDYSPRSSTSQTYQSKVEEPARSPDLGTHRSPPRSPHKPRRSLLATGVMPGGRFLDNTASSSFKSFDSYKPSLIESLEISNLDSSGFDGNPSMLRANSAGADLTSFTKVTKYERSLIPSNMNNNFLTGTQHITSTVGSLRTNDSQVLTSESYY